MNEKPGIKKIIYVGFVTVFLLFLPVFVDADTSKKDEACKNKCSPVANKSAFLPDCVYYEGNNNLVGSYTDVKDENVTVTMEQCCGCRNVNVFVSLLIKLANWLFTIVGAAALVMFIYGGFIMLTAAGSAERVKKGQGVLVAAVIGLIIIFTAQMGLRFLIKIVLPAETAGGVKVDENLKIILPE